MKCSKKICIKNTIIFKDYDTKEVIIKPFFIDKYTCIICVQINSQQFFSLSDIYFSIQNAKNFLKLRIDYLLFCKSYHHNY